MKSLPKPLHWLPTVLMAALLATTLGCSPAAPTDNAAAGASDDLAEPYRRLLRDNWDVYYLQGSKIGHVHTRARLVKESGGHFSIHTESTEVVALSRGADSVESHTTLATQQTADGVLVSFEAESDMGGAPTISQGRVSSDGKQLLMETAAANQPAKKSAIDWQSGYWAFFGVEENLLLNPMQPGETREFKALLPVFNVVGEIKLVAHDRETTELLNGSDELLRISCSMLPPGSTALNVTLWTNSAGEALKSEQMFGIVAYRATKAIANAVDNTAPVDLNANFMVKVGPLEDPVDCERIVYEISMKDGNPADIFHEGPQQSVKRLDDRRIQLTVYNGNLAEPHPDAPRDRTPPTPADREPTASVQSDDPRIVKMAEGIAVGINSPPMICLELEQFTLQSIDKKNYSQAFATASEVAESLEGDCTEHAVLLTALARAKGIPARVVFGMVYVPDDEAFEYHMWNEVFVAERWCPLDGTRGGAGIDPGYIRLTHSSLKEGNGMEGFVALAQVLGRLKIKVLEQHPAAAVE